MAIYPNAGNTGQTPLHPVNIEQWNEQAASSLNASYPMSPDGVRGTSVSLAIDLDEKPAMKQDLTNNASSAYRPRREPLRRDSMKRREALLKGKEGSRRRTRWENDRLLNNPWAQPPSASDWEVHPTYPKHAVPYYLAPLWDQGMAAHVSTEKKKREEACKKAQLSDESAGTIPRGLREKLKRAKAAKGLLKDLEEQVRVFVKSWEDSAKKEPKEEEPEIDSEDDEIVFVGRNGQMNDTPPSPKVKTVEEEDQIERDRLVFESLANDQGAGFGRWLVHSIASYYGLHTWSITVGDPARREAYVGIPSNLGAGRPPSPVLRTRPLWGMV